MHLRRRTLASSATLAVTVATVVLTTGAQVPALAEGATSKAAESAATDMRTVTAGPASFSVPASWAVNDPARCIRLDRHAIYVGHQDPKAVCPSAAVGRTEAVQVEPLDAAVSPAADVPSMTAAALAAAPTRAKDAVSGQYQVVVSDLKILVTGSYGEDPGAIEQVLASIRPAAQPKAWPTISSAAVNNQYAAARSGAAVNAARAPRAASVQTQAARSASTEGPFNGLGFDACTAPSIGAMSDWLASWYRSVGIYIGGADRACGDGWLNSSWVNTTKSMGWKLIPIYVGLQAPCWPYAGGKINPALASVQGTQAADDAISNMQRFGMGPGSPIYFDMEGYPTSNLSCAAAVKSFTIAWTAELHAKGYRSGYYSSASTGIADLVKWYGTLSPDDVWFADWDNQAITTNWVFPTTNYWPSHQRMHQFLGGHNETYGAYTINIDSNRVDSDVVGDPPRGNTVTQPPVQTTPLPAATDVFHPLATTRVYDSGTDNPLNASTDREVQVTGLANIPANADAVVLNVEVQAPKNAGYIRVTPGGYTSQTAVQEFAAGQTISAVTQVRVGANGTVRLHLSAGSARILLDAQGYFISSTLASSDRFHPLPTARVYGNDTTRLVAGADQSIKIAGLAGVPSTGATAVVANVEVQGATNAGYIRVTPTPTIARTAVQEFVPGGTISNLTTVQLAPDGTISLHLSAGSASVFVDVVGWYGGTTGSVPSDGLYHPLPTARAYNKLALTAGADQDLVLTGLAGVPAGSTAKSVTMTVEVSAPTQAGYVRVTPGGSDSQTAVQEFNAGQTVSNLVTVTLDSLGRARLHLSNGSAIVFLDVVGYSS